MHYFNTIICNLLAVAEVTLRRYIGGALSDQYIKQRRLAQSNPQCRRVCAAYKIERKRVESQLISAKKLILGKINKEEILQIKRDGFISAAGKENPLVKSLTKELKSIEHYLHR